MDQQGTSRAGRAKNIGFETPPDMTLSAPVSLAMQSYGLWPDILQLKDLPWLVTTACYLTALKIPEDDYGIEIIPSMEFIDTATAKSTARSSFAVSSVVRDSNKWTEHCTGLIKVEISKPEETRKDEYRHGFHNCYRPTFQGLSEIRADPVQNMASAKLQRIPSKGESPATLFTQLL
ncbi:hypothetical protein K432DRAFT_409230 [Lepidopterella palustris CBS 459.81]|uniref:Uncharacterized protein n=1 Tax=Lepidopterella palustris CBS 459.81 TaxID=1314670 RepID=A0A8E2E0S9_9PEZI|nr:hypothetical protein K432DRAFT_409230 [Lepidopterella palustris CBS 459.81]